MLCFGTKPGVRLRNGNANIKDKMLALFQAVNEREPKGDPSMVSQFHIRLFHMSDRFHVAFFC